MSWSWPGPSIQRATTAYRSRCSTSLPPALRPRQGPGVDPCHGETTLGKRPRIPAAQLGRVPGNQRLAGSGFLKKYGCFRFLLIRQSREKCFLSGNDPVAPGLGILAKGRKATETGAGYQFREPVNCHKHHFDVQKGDIEPENNDLRSIND